MAESAGPGRLLFVMGAGGAAAGCEMWRAGEEQPGRMICWQCLSTAPRPRESFSSPVSTVAGPVVTVGVVVLALTLARWRTTLPAWALMVATAGLVIVAANAPGSRPPESVRSPTT